MPEVPRLMATAMERVFAKPCRVVDVEKLAPRLKRVRFQVPTLVGASVAAHDHIEFRVDSRCFRHYTPSAFEPSTGELDVVFFLHGLGPGSRWASSLDQGSTARMLGPGAGRFRVEPRATRHRLLGDETSLGLASFLRSSLPGELLGALEVDADCLDVAEQSGLEVVHRVKRGERLIDWLGEQTIQEEDVFYLTGHAQTIQRLQRLLRRRDVPRDRVRVDPYWADGKRGL